MGKTTKADHEAAVKYANRLFPSARNPSNDRNDALQRRWLEAFRNKLAELSESKTGKVN